MKFGNFIFDNIPQNIIVYTKIMMNKMVTGASHFSPFNVWILGFELFINFFSCLTNNFDASLHGFYQDPVINNLLFDFVLGMSENEYALIEKMFYQFEVRCPYVQPVLKYVGQYEGLMIGE